MRHRVGKKRCTFLLLAGVLVASICAPSWAASPAIPGIWLDAVSRDALYAATQADTQVAAGEADGFQFPLSNYSSPSPGSGLDFGEERDKPEGKLYHLGEDVYAPASTPVFATANGEVKYANTMTNFGGVALIDHQLPDGSHVCSVVGHLKLESLHSLGPVGVGEQVGVIGTREENGGSDVHLHFGIRKGACPDPPGSPWGLSPDPAELDNWWDPTDFVEAHSGQEPRANRLAYIGADGNIWLVNVDTNQQEQLTTSGTVQTFAWAPTGEALAFARWMPEDPSLPHYLQLVLLNVAQRREVVLWDRVDFNVWTIAWAPDGTHLALLAYGGTPNSGRVLLLEVSTGATSELLSWPAGEMGWEELPMPAFGMSWSPDGQRLLVNAAPAFTAVLEVSGGRRASKTIFFSFDKSDTSLTDRFCMGPHWSSDGQRIVCRDSDAILVVGVQGTILREYPIADAGESASWSPDGTKIAADGHSGLWVIDTETGAVTQILSRATWKPFWSPDGEKLAFSLYYGGQGTPSSESIRVIRVDGTALRELEQGSSLPAWQPTQAPPGSPCGAWQGTASDERIELTRISDASGDECRGAFTFSNSTDVWGFGGYTLELRTVRSDNATTVWIALPSGEEGTKPPLLLPSLDLDLYTFPLDRASAAEVTLEGVATLRSLGADTALFLLKAALEFVPGGSCVVPDEQLAYVSVRVAHILAPVAQMVWDGDLVGAKEELQQLLPAFLHGSSAALREIGVDCGADLLEALIGLPAALVKLVWAYCTWIPVFIIDYFKYEGQPVVATLKYMVPTPVPPGSGRIAFVSNRDGQPGIFLMNPDGSEVTKILGIDAARLACSPDGRRFVFADYYGSTSTDIFVVSVDGSGLVNLTKNPASDYGPAWSPDGTHIAFDSDRDGTSEIYVMNADGTNLIRLTDEPSSTGSPSWSPDGERIAFSAEIREGQLYKGSYIGLVSTDDDQVIRITDALPGGDLSPAWSPDGDRIAFASNGAIYVMNQDGSGLAQLTNGSDWRPIWSPDGRLILFERLVGSNFEIFRVNVDGSGETNLTNSPGDDRYPCWLP